MTLPDTDLALVLALSPPPDGSPSLWVQLVPFLLILGIFYFVILMPMRRRQKKVAEFQAALKAGDRVVTTGGIYGQITKVNDATVQLQVAPNVRHRGREGDRGRAAGAAAGRPRLQHHVTVMNSNLTWKVITVAAVVALSVWSFYPPEKKVRLGLDLKGGVHLVMRVQTDDALKVETETSAERLREELAGRNMAVAGVTAEPPTRFTVTGVPQAQDQEFRQVAEEQTAAVYDRSSSAGGTYTFTIKPNVERNLRDESVKQALQTIERRVNELGVAEPIVAPHGTANDQILVQLPGVSDVNRAKEIIRSTALLELKIVDEGPAPTREALLQAHGGAVPANMDVVTGVSTQPGGGTVFYLVRKAASITGRDLRNARPSLDENNQPAVSFSLNNDGAVKFGKVTQENIGRQLAIILDGRVQSAPVIESRITDEGRISGTFTQQEVADLSLVLRSGALPASLTYLEERTVGPSLGADSIRAGVTASLTGLALVAVFMLLYYKLSGHQRDHDRGPEPGHPARLHVLHRRDDDAARRRGLHPDDRHGRGLQRAHLRAHQGGTAGRQGRPPGGVGRVRPRLPHDSGYAHRVAHRGGVPLPVRHGPHPRVRHHALLRPAVQRLHGRLRVPHAVRGDPLAA